MEQTTLIKLFISCPSDITSELNSIRIIVNEINKISGREGGYIIETLNWKDDTYSAIGLDAQDVINNQIDDEYDILVSLIWQKLGTPTKREKSGTVEEINRAIVNTSKRFLIFFKTSVENLNDIDLDELQRINNYKKELSTKGVLYKDFNLTSEFEALFRFNLTKLIADFLSGKQISTQIIPSKAIPENKYSEIEQFLDDIENQDVSNIDIDIFNLVEEGLSYLNNTTSSMNNFTSIIGDFGDRLSIRTDEINKYAHIKDERLRISKSKTVIRLLSGELDVFANRIRTELPIFSENFIGITVVYPKILYISNKYETEDTESLKSSFKEFRDSMESTINSATNFLREITNWPPIDSRFNKSKREVEIVIKDLTREMLTGLKIFDEFL